MFSKKTAITVMMIKPIWIMIKSTEQIKNEYIFQFSSSPLLFQAKSRNKNFEFGNLLKDP